MIKLYCVRHAESTGNASSTVNSQEDCELSEQGQKQAKLLVSSLQKIKFDLAIHSGLKRTLQTIQPWIDDVWKSEKKIEIRTNRLIMERDIGPMFTGKPTGTYKKFCDENQLDMITYTPVCGESLINAQVRAEIFLEDIKKEFTEMNRTILICSHQTFLQVLRCTIEQKNINTFYELPRIENTEILEFML